MLIAVPALAVKAAKILLTTDKGRKAVGWVVALALSPLILIAVIICCLGSATADHNVTAIELCFNGGEVGANIPAEYREQIHMTQANFSRLDAAIAAAEGEMEDGDSLDSIRVKAIFYALFFGRERYSERDCADFVACFVTEEERIRTLVDEEGNEYEETYEVLVPIKSLPRIYSNISDAFRVDIISEDQINASEIYYRIMYGGPVPSYGSGFDQWSDGLPLSDAPFIGADGFCSPLGENWRDMVTSEFGWRTDPFTGEGRGHGGIDLGAPTGTPIRAALDGTVYFVRYSSEGYGYHLGIDHGGGFVTIYAHCSEIMVTEGQEVEAGDIIAKVGSTGRSTGPHLHFEIRINGEKQNPRSYLP